MITLLFYILGGYVGLGLSYIVLRWLVIIIKEKFFGYYYGNGGFFINPFPILQLIMISLVFWPVILFNDFHDFKEKRKRKLSRRR